MVRLDTVTWEQAEQKLSGISNLFLPEQAHILFDQAQAVPDGSVILEIGAFKGYSTCALALACLGTTKQVYTIDTFTGNLYNTNLQDGASYYGEFQANLIACGVQEIVHVLIGRSDEYYSYFKESLGLLFIDGGHEMKTVQADLNAFLPRLKPGGLLLMHDVYANDFSYEYPTWFQVTLPLTNCQNIYNLVWGTKL